MQQVSSEQHLSCIARLLRNIDDVTIATALATPAKGASKTHGNKQQGDTVCEGLE